MVINDDTYYPIQFCTEVIEDLIANYKKYKIKPILLVSLSKSLHALKSKEPGIVGYIEIASAYTWKGGGTSISSLTIFDDYIEIYVGGSEYDPSVGSDSYTTLMCSTSVYNDFSMDQLNFWKESFYSHLDNPEALRITDEAEILEH